MLFWEMVDVLGWLAGAALIGGTAWAVWYLVTDGLSRRRRQATTAAWSDPSLRDRVA